MGRGRNLRNQAGGAHNGAMRAALHLRCWFRSQCLLAAAISAALLGVMVPAAAQMRPLAQWKGYAGGGAITFPKYTGSRASETIAAPLLMFEYKETVYVDLVRAGIRLWSNADRSLAFGIAAEPRFGFRAADGARLAGMATRRDSIEIGPNLEWESPALSANVALFRDVNGASGGASLRAGAYHQLIDSGRWDLGLYGAIDRANAKVANYYFGVRGDEATLVRPFYQPGATTHLTAGVSAAYRFSERHAVLFGVQATRLGAGAAASPIAEVRNAAIAYAGLGWRL